MQSLTVACVWVQGHVPFSARYVVRLRNMVARHLDRPHRFVCLTDRTLALPEIETVGIRWANTLKGWWAKVELFKPGRFDGRVLYLDLDTLIVDALDAIVDYQAPAAFVPDAGTFQGKEGKAVVKRFNSSVMVWDAGTLDVLYARWSSAVAHRLWGDQDWAGEQVPNAALMPLEWFPRLSQCPDGPPAGAKVILAKVPKNEIAAQRYPWFAERWR